MSAPGDADPRGVAAVDGLDELRELEALGDLPTFRASTARKLVELKINYRNRAVAAESRLAASEADRAALERRVAELEGALRPFAEAGRHIPESWSNTRPAAHVNSDARFPGTVSTISTYLFRLAARALTPGASS